MKKMNNSFPYAVFQLILYVVALAKSMSQDTWKYEPQYGNLIQVSVARAALRKIKPKVT